MDRRWKHDVAITQKQSCVACMIFFCYLSQQEDERWVFYRQKRDSITKCNKNRMQTVHQKYTKRHHHNKREKQEPYNNQFISKPSMNYKKRLASPGGFLYHSKKDVRNSKMINMLHIFQDFVIMLFLHAQNRRPNLLKAYACARKNGKIFR